MRPSRFWFWVPLEKRPADEGGQEASVAPNGVRVLVADDNETNRTVLAEQLRSWNMRSDSVSDSESAIRILRRAVAQRDPFGIAVLDEEMPGMNGLSLAARVRSDPALATTKIVLMVPLLSAIPEAALRSAGISESISKPVQQSKFFNCLMNAIGHVETPPVVEVRDSANKPAAFGADAPMSHRGIRILLAEDNAINRKVALGQLSRLGFSADCSANGRETVAAFLTANYDIILMDCQMPELDGYEATREIRQLEKERSSEGRKPICIIALTAHAMKGDREKCLEAGMDDYLTKPLKTATLKEALDRWAPTCQKDAAVASVDSSVGSEPEVEPPAGQAAPSVDSNTGSVDLERLREMGGDDDAAVIELVDLYYSQAEDMLQQLGNAIEFGAAGDVKHFSHKLRGASATCGINSMVDPLCRLEEMGAKGELSGARELLAVVSHEYAVVREYLDRQLRRQ